MSLPALGASLAFLVLATITGLFGFGAITDEAPLAAKLFSAFFLCSALGAFWWGWVTRTRPSADGRRAAPGSHAHDQRVRAAQPVTSE